MHKCPYFMSLTTASLFFFAGILYSWKNWRWRGKLETLRGRKYMCVVQNETGGSNKVDASCNKAYNAWAINLLEWAQRSGVFPGLPLPLAAHHLFTPKDKAWPVSDVAPLDSSPPVHEESSSPPSGCCLMLHPLTLSSQRHLKNM